VWRSWSSSRRPRLTAPTTPTCFATCHELGITEVYRAGGAQAVGALAYGVEGIEPVDIVVGPGNLFVALAKKHVYGEVSIDSIAGPSEVVVIADETTRPEFTAMDLFAQAEHSPGASILITWNEAALNATYDEVVKRVDQLDRGDLTRQALENFGALILTRDADEACEIANLIAPEHLHIATDNAAELVDKIPCAGAAFWAITRRWRWATTRRPVACVADGRYSSLGERPFVARFPSRWQHHRLRRTGHAKSRPGCSTSRRQGRPDGPPRQRRHPRGIDAACGLALTTNNEHPMTTFRPNISAMAGYAPGEQPQFGKFIKLNTNENPYPPSETVVRAIVDAARSGLARYPDPIGDAFRRRAADVLGVEHDWILCGNGSDDVLTILTRAFVGEGELLRLPYPSYVLYKTLADIQGARAEEVPFDDQWSLGDDFAAAAEGLRIAFLPNPNSPSGTMIEPTEILRLAERLPCPLLVDEAYADFAETNCISLVKENERIMVSRTMSKSYGLAGLRFGFLVAQPPVIAELMKVKDSYNCDALSIAGATAAIDDQDWLVENRKKVLATRERLAKGMVARGFTVTDSHANFVWCTHSERPLQPVYEQLKSNRILVRYMNYPDWGDGLRISVGTNDQIDALLSVLDIG
jgi:histidinol-phosphate aminotransferase